jgi:opacity protein-like surface antigen
MVFDAKYTHGVGYQARAVGVYGAGIDADITSHLFVRAEYRGLIYDPPTYDLRVLAGMDRVTQRFEPSIGFGWRF